MTKPFLYWLFAPIQLLPMLRQLAKQLGDGGEAELSNFGVPICTIADPLTIVANGGCSGPVGQATVDYLEAMLESDPRLQNVTWARCSNDSNSLVLRTSHLPTQARIDSGETVYWDIDKALADNGVQFCNSPDA